ncbi:hypothetical protein AB1Y20_002513 [Prymnesium parvum]|uniref:Uncharacterized protein n=1 Tax=Prymnesium parvum TaxID=97485 RepID=A0AB34J9H5_PRYPA
MAPPLRCATPRGGTCRTLLLLSVSLPVHSWSPQPAFRQPAAPLVCRRGFPRGTAASLRSMAMGSPGGVAVGQADAITTSEAQRVEWDELKGVVRRLASGEEVKQMRGDHDARDALRSFRIAAFQKLRDELGLPSVDEEGESRRADDEVVKQMPRQLEEAKLAWLSSQQVAKVAWLSSQEAEGRAGDTSVALGELDLATEDETEDVVHEMLSQPVTDLGKIGDSGASDEGAQKLELEMGEARRGPRSTKESSAFKLDFAQALEAAAQGALTWLALRALDEQHSKTRLLSHA